MSGVIEAEHYREARQALCADPIVQDMAAGVRHEPLDELQHESGTPRFEFMLAANEEYRSRGGKVTAHLGGVAEAILLILNSGNHYPDLDRP